MIEINTGGTFFMAKINVPLELWAWGSQKGISAAKSFGHDRKSITSKVYCGKSYSFKKQKAF